MLTTTVSGRLTHPNDARRAAQNARAEMQAIQKILMAVLPGQSADTRQKLLTSKLEGDYQRTSIAGSRAAGEADRMQALSLLGVFQQ